jgi:hypothetical protein
MSLDRDRFIQLAQIAESVGGATALLQRNDHRYVPIAIRNRLTRVREDLSLIFSELTRELRATEETP